MPLNVFFFLFSLELIESKERKKTKIMRIVVSKVEKNIKVPFSHKTKLAIHLENLVSIFSLSKSNCVWTVSNCKPMGRRNYVFKNSYEELDP